MFHSLLVSGDLHFSYIIRSQADFSSFQYTFNFIVYAARSEQYRAAFSRYLAEKCPCVRGCHAPKIHSTIFIINPGVSPSDTELYKKRRNKNKEIDVKLKYSLGNERIKHSYSGTIEVNVFIVS